MSIIVGTKLSDGTNAHIKTDDDGIQYSRAKGDEIIAEGVKTIAAAATPEALVATSTPCALVWVAAPLTDAGAASNTSVIRVSLAGTAAFGFQIAPTDGKGYYIRVTDANDLLVRAGTNGDKVVYAVLG